MNNPTFSDGTPIFPQRDAIDIKAIVSNWLKNATDEELLTALAEANRDLRFPERNIDDGADFSEPLGG